MINQLRKILDNLPMMIGYKDTNNNVLTINLAAAKFMGQSVEEFKNIHMKYIFPNDYKRYYEYDLEIMKSKKPKLEIIEKHNINGKEVFIEISIIPVLNENNEVENFVIFMIDITNKLKLEKENKQKEQLLYHQSKMAAMGEMIGNIAHQWKQPLSAISTASTGILLKKELSTLNDEDLLESMDLINNSTQYLSQTIDDFRNFFNPKESQKSKFIIENTISKTLKLIDIYLKGNKLVIEIKDNAEGIKEDIINRIFEPYFTTKHQSQGTGIGLYMSQEIVTKLLKGTLSVGNETYIYNNNKYKGAIFKIEISI